ncbi:MAG: hypothetical protein IKN04_08825 [Clostridia bacterium]|nr:hypothetical protein [Clostridia bacterium]MBR6186808.1 hypothetical protein [Clostridia bacterium]
MNGKNERDFRIAVAGHSVAVHALHTRVFSLCKEYLTDLAPDMEISVTESDLESERQEAKKSRSPQQNDAYLETLAVYRKISEKMLAYDTFLMHGAVVATGGNAYMFTAVSGTGKTTHIKKWLKYVDDAFVVNGDKPLIKITDTQAIACGTPWCGKEGFGANAMVPLKAIVMMERGEENVMEKISFSQAFLYLLQQTYRPAGADQMRKTLSLLSVLRDKVCFYRFRFNNLADDAFSVSYQALTGDHAGR